jgi:hypothetical protein
MLENDQIAPQRQSVKRIEGKLRAKTAELPAWPPPGCHVPQARLQAPWRFKAPVRTMVLGKRHSAPATIPHALRVAKPRHLDASKRFIGLAERHIPAILNLSRTP